jgi:calcium-dependent protein kinase
MLVAMKFFGYIEKGKPDISFIEREIIVDAELRDLECTCKLIGYSFDSYDGYNAHIIRKKITGKPFKGRFLVKVSECLERDLIDTIVRTNSFSEQTASTVCRNITLALKEVHDAGVIHRDLKLDNIMFIQEVDSVRAAHVDADNFHVKIIDFGACAYLPRGQDFILGPRQEGTDCYFAPETLVSRPALFERYIHSKASDVWQLGATIYMLLFATNPSYHIDGEHFSFQYGGKNGRLDGYSSENLYFPPYKSGMSRISETGKDLLRRLLDRNPSSRMTCLEVLQHDWITDFASLKKEDFGAEYRDAIKASKLQRHLRAAIINSINYCVDLKRKIVDLLQPADAKLNISTDRFRSLQSEFIDSVSEDESTYSNVGITFPLFENILKRNELAYLATPEVFREFDKDGNESIDYFEFLSVLSAMRETTMADDVETEQCRHYFQMFDRNGDGSVSKYTSRNSYVLIIIFTCLINYLYYVI